MKKKSFIGNFTVKFNNYFTSFHCAQSTRINIIESAVIGLGSKKMEHMYYVASRRVQNMSPVY